MAKISSPEHKMTIWPHLLALILQSSTAHIKSSAIRLRNHTAKNIPRSSRHVCFSQGIGEGSIGWLPIPRCRKCRPVLQPLHGRLVDILATRFNNIVPCLHGFLHRRRRVLVPQQNQLLVRPDVANSAGAFLLWKVFTVCLGVKEKVCLFAPLTVEAILRCYLLAWANTCM